MTTSDKTLLEKALEQKEISKPHKLRQHHDVIAVLRHKKWTFAKIAEFLRAEGVEVSIAWLSKYWKDSQSIPQTRPLAKKVLMPKRSLDQGPKQKKEFHFEDFDEEDFTKAFKK